MSLSRRLLQKSVQSLASTAQHHLPIPIPIPKTLTEPLLPPPVIKTPPPSPITTSHLHPSININTPSRMENPSTVHLHPSVENLITKICLEKGAQPPDISARRALSRITEASAKAILYRVSAASSVVSNFSGHIIQSVKDVESVAVSETTFVLPQKRSSPPSFTDSPQKYAHHISPPEQFAHTPGSCSNPITVPERIPGCPEYAHYIPTNSKQFVHSPGSPLNPITIADYVPGSPNDGYGSLVAKKITSLPSSGIKDVIPNNASSHLAASSKVTNRVQKQLLFATGCELDDRNHSMVSQQLFDSSNTARRFSVFQKQYTLSPCSRSGTNDSRFCDISSATNNGSLVPVQRSLPPRASTAGPINNLAISDQSLLLAELEFRKLFLVYSYIGRKKLEDVVSVEDAIELSKMKTMSMFDFEAKIWADYGRKFCQPSDRAMHLDWDSGKTHLYHCHVNVNDGTYQFKGPFLGPRRTHLQRELGDDNVLIVQFADDQDTPEMLSNHRSFSAVKQSISAGISIGLRHYRLFSFKDARDKKSNKGKNAKKPRSTSAFKCYFIRKESHAPWAEKDDCILLNKTVHEARCLFMHVHMVSSMAKYVSRCSLALSNTIKLRVDIASVHVERIEDIPCRDEYGYVVCDEDDEPLIHTDGTGFISEDLAILCAKDFTEAKSTKGDSYEFVNLFKLEEESRGIKGKESYTIEPPLLVQCRLFKEGYVVKGTLLLNRKLKPRTIQVRPSMIKVETDTRLSDSPSFSSLEICTISQKPHRATLSKNLIALLSVGGVPKDYFMELLETALQDAQKVSSSMRAAVRVGLNYGQMDDFASVAMIGSGIPLDEPYLQHRLSILANEERKGLRSGRIPVTESFYLIGTADPTGTLNSDEVCVILENGQISGKVLVYRNPGLHFGDVHILNAKYVEKLEEYVGNAKYGIFFPTKGKRSVGSEIGDGDFDGDIYWVSRSPQLLHYFKASEPWKRMYSTPSAPSKKPSDLSPEERETELFTLLFSSQKQTMVAGKAADSWLTLVDQYLMLGENNANEKNRLKDKMLKLVDLYYDALDAPKSGKSVDIPSSLLALKYPHYMERPSNKSYHSSSVLGEIYDTAKAYQPDDALIRDIWKIPCFSVEIPDTVFNLWKNRYDLYRKEMSDALQSGDESKNNSANIVINKYKQMLYEAEDFATSSRKIEDIYNEALAIYHASYNYAIKWADVGKCGFAWKVAGEALCSFHELKTPGRSIPFKTNVLSMFI